MPVGFRSEARDGFRIRLRLLTERQQKGLGQHVADALRIGMAVHGGVFRGFDEILAGLSQIQQRGRVEVEHADLPEHKVVFRQRPLRLKQVFEPVVVEVGVTERILAEF